MIKQSLKLSVVALFALGLVACSSKAPEGGPAGASNASLSNTDGVQTAGLGQTTGFDDADDQSQARMNRILGIDKNIVYFDFDSSVIKPDFDNILQANAKYLKDHADAKILVSGNTDPRGSREYNIGLGQRRSDQVSQRLAMLGVNKNQIVTVSYGAEKPAMPGNTEDAYREDRRAEITYQQAGQ